MLSVTLSFCVNLGYFVTYPIDDVSVHRRSSGSNGADDGSQSRHGYDEAGGNKASNDHHRGNERKGKRRPIGRIVPQRVHRYLNEMYSNVICGTGGFNLLYSLILNPLSPFESHGSGMMFFNQWKMHYKRDISKTSIQRERKQGKQKYKVVCKVLQDLQFDGGGKKTKSLLFLVLVVGTIKLLVRMLFVFLELISSLGSNRHSWFNDISLLQAVESILECISFRLQRGGFGNQCHVGKLSLNKSQQCFMVIQPASQPKKILF